MLRMRAAAALCAASRLPPKARRSLHLGAERDLGRIDAERMPWSSALAEALRGELRLQQGREDEAQRSWALASTRLSAVNMEGSAAVARRCLGLLPGGETGEAQVRVSDDWLTRHGVVDPERVGWLHGSGYGT
jgi:hypothetical protein